ncbi:MAG TPA: lamin tail domain-containing protein, partial [Candidatus Nanoarchaeia archaeon]|nr:lamin tail domain-containing protein [Candidatus Nanoarchaeia archaeon]
MAVFASADVLINEFLPSGVFDPNSEWIELFNNGTSSVNITDWNLTDGEGLFTIPNISINPQEFIVFAENFTFFNATYPSVNASGIRIIDYGPQSTVGLSFANGGDQINLTNSSGSVIDNITYTSSQINVSIGRHPDGTLNIISLTVPTPGTKNDNVPPIFNKWLKPFINNSKAQASLNITVNITDAASTVNTSLVDFNGTNFSMTKDGDIWFFLWEISKSIDKLHNITVYFNDSNGFGSSNTIFNITAGHPPSFNKWINPS